jgi:sodium transport system permease protein
MNSPFWIVTAKEILENIRDRRTVLTALLFGPLFGPVLFAAMLGFSVDRALDDDTSSLELEVSAAEQAPNLIAFLASRGIDARPVGVDLAGAREAVAAGTSERILVLPPDYAEDVASGRTARIRLVSDRSDQSGNRDTDRVRRALAAYGQRIGLLRLQARGVDPGILQPLAVDEIDISTPAGRSVLLLGMISYFLLFAVLMGGFYLAIDTTAGERERRSLEPLLGLPVPRAQLVGGKILATWVFMMLSLLIALAAFAASLQLVPFEELGMRSNFGFGVAAGIFMALTPFAVFAAGLLTLVASFTRSYREAQSYLTAVLLVPTVPIIFANFAGVRPGALTMAVPSLSQHLLITQLLKAEPPPMLQWAISASVTAGLGLMLVWLVVRLYERESILG